MTILGISTSSKYASAAVMKNGAVVSFHSENGQETGRSHSEMLMELIGMALADAEADKKEIGAIAVDIGPGSFTGVRIGVSCANAMAFALSIPVIPVCSLTAMCLGDDIFISEIEAPDDTGSLPVIHAALIDCRNGNCYGAAYDSEMNEVIAPCAAVTAELTARLPEGAVMISGDAAEGTKRDAHSYPNAKQVLNAALRLGIPAVKQAVPMYLRPSQAERMKKADS